MGFSLGQTPGGNIHIFSSSMKAAEVLVEKADGRIDTSLRPRTVEDGKLALVCSAKTKCDELSDTETASTSRKPLSSDQSCWNCEAVFTPAHQCNGSSEPVSEVSALKLPDPTVRTDDPGRTIAPRRGLNIKKFCVHCEQRHRAGQKCPLPNCVTPLGISFLQLLLISALCYL